MGTGVHINKIQRIIRLMLAYEGFIPIITEKVQVLT